jgi:glycerol-3-phosphate dehydrogenase
MTGSPHLNAQRRERELEQLVEGETVDVLVIGGGITGCGVALDAAGRGLSVALVERGDLASGTSGFSSKLVHGGLRYLAHGQVGVAAESARERHVLMTRTATHLCRPMASVAPLDDRLSGRSRALIETGYRLGDILRMSAGTSRRALPPSRRVALPEALALVPALRTDGVRGAIVGWDGRLEDDARLVVAVARTAAAYGARIITRCGVTGVERGRACAFDRVSEQSFELSARHIVNATGAWAGELAPNVRLRPSKGSHLIVPAARLGHPRGVLTVAAHGGSAEYVFAAPLADDRVAIGLTDEELEGPVPEAPTVSAEEERFLLRAISAALDAQLSVADVIGRYAGVRPLLDSGLGETTDLSRRHSVIEDLNTAVLTIVGGKLTTYRKMAQDAVDRIAAREGVRCGPCITARLPLVGALPAEFSSSQDVPARLVRRYGAEAAAVAALAAANPELLDPVADGVPVLGVEFAFGVRSELAMGAEDLLDRRTRLGLVESERGLALGAAREALDEFVAA